MAQLSSPRTRAACSWVSGWLTVLAWLFLTASAPFGAGTLIQGLLTLNYPEYVRERWHGTMLYWAVLVVGFLVNLFAPRLLPHIENLMMALHVLFFFLIFVTILALSPTRNSAEFVFGEFQNNTGWGSDGIAWSLGMVTSAYVMVGMYTPRAIAGCCARLQCMQSLRELTRLWSTVQVMIPQPIFPKR